MLAPDDAAAGSPRRTATETGEFELTAPAVVVTTGGIGANHDLVRRYWPERLGIAPGVR